jgi:hypothetical protein
MPETEELQDLAERLCIALNLSGTFQDAEIDPENGEAAVRFYDPVTSHEYVFTDLEPA